MQRSEMSNMTRDERTWKWFRQEGEGGSCRLQAKQGASCRVLVSLRKTEISASSSTESGLMAVGKFWPLLMMLGGIFEMLIDL